MEKSKTLNPNERPNEHVKNDTWGGSCSFWIFGNEDSAKNDLDDTFEVVDDEKKD